MNSPFVVDHIGIAVADLPRAAAFLTDVFGMRLLREARSPELGLTAAFFDAGPVAVELLVATDPEEQRSRLDGRSGRLDHLALRVGDLPVAAAGLCAHGALFRDQSDPHRPPPAVRVGATLNLFTDPSTTQDVTFQILQRLTRPTS